MKMLGLGLFAAGLVAATQDGAKEWAWLVLVAGCALYLLGSVAESLGGGRR